VLQIRADLALDHRVFSADDLVARIEIAEAIRDSMMPAPALGPLGPNPVPPTSAE
jgi:hypothetical protein